MIRKTEKQASYSGEDPKHLSTGSISENGYEGRDLKKYINVSFLLLTNSFNR